MSVKCTFRAYVDWVMSMSQCHRQFVALSIVDSLNVLHRNFAIGCIRAEYEAFIVHMKCCYCEIESAVWQKISWSHGHDNTRECTWGTSVSPLSGPHSLSLETVSQTDMFSLWWYLLSCGSCLSPLLCLHTDRSRTCPWHWPRCLNVERWITLLRMASC